MKDTTQNCREMEEDEFTNNEGVISIENSFIQSENIQQYPNTTGTAQTSNRCLRNRRGATIFRNTPPSMTVYLLPSLMFQVAYPQIMPGSNWNFINQLHSYPVLPSFASPCPICALQGVFELQPPTRLLSLSQCTNNLNSMTIYEQIFVETYEIQGSVRRCLLEYQEIVYNESAPQSLNYPWNM